MPLVDIIVGYDCNLGCDYCTITPEMRTRALPTAAIFEALQLGRRRGIRSVSFTGGEPTLRSDLIGLVSAARQLGYDDIKLQTNGLVLAAGANIDRLIAAGVTRFHVSIHDFDAGRYETTVRRAGTYRLMTAALDALVARGLRLVVDVIVRSETYERLASAIAWLHERGVREVHLWYVSLTDGNADNHSSLPPMSEAIPHMRAAFAWGRAHGMSVLSLHVPRCLLGDDRSHAYDPGADEVIVVTPDATFELKDSRLAGQVHVAACDGCEHRAICPGVRPDYLEQFGDGEIAAARALGPTRAGRIRLPLAR